MLRNAMIVELLEAYRQAAKIHSSSSLTGDYRLGNLQADIIATIYRELRNRGGDAEMTLKVWKKGELKLP